MQVGLVNPAHVLRYRHVVRWTSDNIRERRDALGMTQEQLAERVGASLRTVWGWEDGATPQKKWTAKLDEVLGEPPEHQLRRESLANKSAAQLVAEISERLTALASRVSDGPSFSGVYEAASDELPSFVSEALSNSHESRSGEATG